MTCKSRQAGHRIVVYEVYDTERCPVCEAIERLDKQLLAADVRIAELEKRLIPNPNWVDWNGGHS